MEYYGYAGNILYVDLSTGHIRKESLDAGLARKFIGGQGIGIRLLHDLLKPNIDPLSPQNVMIFGAGPLIGTIVPGCAKCCLSTKYAMPASRDGKKYFISTSMSGSNRFGIMMKNAGYDHVVITGRAEKPSYLKVTDEDVEICDASDLWGKDLYEAGRILKERHQGRAGNCGIWVIGPAGENLVRFALGFTDNWWNLGRFAGAVAGSKNLKAVVTLGAKGIRVADVKRLMELVGEKTNEIQGNPNYQSVRPLSIFTHSEILDKTKVDVHGCSSCLSACKYVHEVKEGRHKGVWFGGSYPGAIYGHAVGLQLDKQYSQNYGEAFKLTGTLNKYGLCRITTKNMIVFVTKLYERGIISKEDMGGLEPKMGDVGYYLALIEKIIHKEDIGAIMAKGWYPLCEKLGVDASTDWEAGWPITKGIDVLVDTRIRSSGQEAGFCPAIGFAEVIHAKAKHTHDSTYWSTKERSLADLKRDVEKMAVIKEELDRIFTENSFNTGRVGKHSTDAETTYNSLGLCDTMCHDLYDPMRDIPWLAEVYSALTGFEITPRELLRAGERIWNLEKLLNVREGFNREDDKIPPLYIQNIETPIKALDENRAYLTDWLGKRLKKEDLERMLDDYYDERGWDIQKGVPTREKLIELGLQDFIGIIDGM